VQHCLPELLRNQAWPNTLQAAAVGPGTANALAQFGIDCLLPESRFDSEGLLARPELQTTAVQGQSVLLLRGDGGRELLADTLTQRGANVEAIACYARHAPANLAAPFRATWLTGTLDGILISSSEGLDNLLAGTSAAEHDKLFLTPLFVPHPRIAEKAKSAGFLNVILTPPAEAGMLAGLLAYNWAH
jgi:uroporphyrinogen-III synthase